jgi:hypothetical protein
MKKKKKHPLYEYLNYLIKDCYKEDYDPYEFEFLHDLYHCNMTFSEWYFMYRRRWHLNPKKKGQYRDKAFTDNYKHTHDKLIVGDLIFGSGYMLY